MTAFVPANLPASVDTLEKLIVWSCSAFYTLHKETKYQESDAAPLIPVATVQDGWAANKTERAIYRLSMQLNDGWRESSSKIFEEVVELSNAAIPPAFLP